MKKIIFAGILLGAAIFCRQSNAQGKKTVAKARTSTRQTAPADKAPLLHKINFFSLTPDNAIQTLNDEFKKIKITLKDIREGSSYYYDATGKKGNILSNTRTLIFDNKMQVGVVSDEDDVIKEISFSLFSGNGKQLKAVKTMLAYNSWPQVALAENDTTYRNGNMLVNSSSYISRNDKGEFISESFQILMKQVSPYTYVPKNFKAFDPTTLNVYNNSEDVAYAIVDAMKKQGINLLYKDENLPVTSEEGLSNYSCDYKFSHGVCLTINTSVARKLKFIFIDCNDPITFSRLKKTFGILQWQKAEHGEYDDADDDCYKHDNVTAVISPSGKDIVFRINPLVGDTQTRLENTVAPSFDDLVNLYMSGTPDEVAKSIGNTYMNQIKVDTVRNKLVHDPVGDKFDFYYSTSYNSHGRCRFNYNNPDFYKSTRFYVGSVDLAYMKTLMSQYLASKFRSKYIYMMKLDGKVVTFPSDFDQIWFRDKAVIEQETAQAQAEKQRQDEEVARRKEQDRLNAIEKQKKRDAQSAATLKIMEGILNGNFGKKQ